MAKMSWQKQKKLVIDEGGLSRYLCHAAPKGATFNVATIMSCHDSSNDHDVFYIYVADNI